MRKKLLAVFLVLFMCITMFGNYDVTAQAEDILREEELDFSCFTVENSIVGYLSEQTRGVYLVDGNSFISNMGVGKIGIGGSTTAAIKCNVSVTCILEKYESGVWNHVQSWRQANTNAYSAAVSKALYVATGKYYRVRSVHYAGTDTGSSYTSAYWAGTN